MNIFYNIIYSSKINWVLRNLNFFLAKILLVNFKIHPSGILKVSINKKQNIYLKTNQTSYVSRELFWKKSKNYEYSCIFMKLIKKMSCFFDVGASIGYYSILGAKINPDLKVYSFEPSIGPMIYLSENIKINNFEDRINVNVVALSDKIGKIDFYEVFNNKYSSVYNLSGEHNLGTKSNLKVNKTLVESNTLDNFIKQNNIGKIDLIKLDTEGCEDLILKASTETIKRDHPIIICEVLFNKIEDSLELIMNNLGYEFYNHVENYLEKVDSIKRSEDNGVRNCFFVPPNKRYLISDFLR
ncbi:MAG: hypothetical protein CO068_13565 [Flavobacteriaceae bacterium CG_4_9_14_0_8_um_filter_34_30]|nr:MAG: hypothetical protein COY56_11640 [Flavobacteriaceae bacterium CG_4_10_14_0_8_um_filter_34_31]PJC05976.1 MAG: hypothetical protein CO068_13565 [Flavobacteriaceae bacterium CG_4_9_14_0_8_um_filter_34_30]